jgi:hypothetical protein
MNQLIKTRINIVLADFFDKNVRVLMLECWQVSSLSAATDDKFEHSQNSR